MRVRPAVAALAALVLTFALAVTTTGPAVAAAVASNHSADMTIFITQTERNVLDLGATGTTVGDVVTGAGTVSKSRGGRTIGSFAYRSETVRVGIPGGVENRLSTIWFAVPGGSLMASTVINVPSGTRPVKNQEYVILGGTGKYAGSAGDMTFTPLSPNTYKIAFHFTD